MLAAGLLIGLVQGLLIAYGGVPSFVITLGGLLFFRNAAFYINSGVTIAPLNKTFQLLGGGLDGTIGAFWSWVVCAACDRCRHRLCLARRPPPGRAWDGRPLAGDA